MTSASCVALRPGRGRSSTEPRASRSLAVSSSVAARAADRAVSGRRAPGIATTAGESPRSQASATSAGVAACASTTSANAPRRAIRPARRGPPSGECAITATSRSTQRATTPPRIALSSYGLSATCTAATGTSASASSSWSRLTFDTPMRLTRPSSASRASARKVVRHGVRGSGAWMRYRSISRPSSAARLASQSARIDFARPSGTHRPSGRAIPPLVTIRARRSALQRRSAEASSLSLLPYARAVSKTVMPASTAALMVSTASSESRLSSVDSRMQPRPMRSSESSSHPRELRSRTVSSSRLVGSCGQEPRSA